MNKLRSASEETADLTSEDESTVPISGVPVDMTINSVYHRYDDTARKLARRVRRVKDLSYDMEPILVADQVNGSILEELPSAINGFHVHKFVINNCLYITNLSTGNPHAGGVMSIGIQTSVWNAANGNYFLPYSDAVAKFGPNKSGAPDLKLNIMPVYRPDNQNPSLGRLNMCMSRDCSYFYFFLQLSSNWKSAIDLLSECLEISHTISTILELFRLLESSALVQVMQSVLFIWKYHRNLIFSFSAERPIERMVAVQWNRVQGEIVVASVKDFGINSISNETKRLFSEVQGPATANDLQPLPPVPRDMWDEAGNRCDPLANGAAGNLEDAMAWIYRRRGPQDLYVDSTTPTVTFAGADLVTALNLPPELNPVVLEDFVLNLGAVLFGVAIGV
jgi:hypothetical protein